MSLLLRKSWKHMKIIVENGLVGIEKFNFPIDFVT